MIDKFKLISHLEATIAALKPISKDAVDVLTALLDSVNEGDFDICSVSKYLKESNNESRN